MSGPKSMSPAVVSAGQAWQSARMTSFVPFRAASVAPSLPHPHEVADRPFLEDVVPAAGDQGRHLDARPLRLDVEVGPVVVVGGPGEPLVVVGGDVAVAPEPREVGEGEPPHPVVEQLLAPFGDERADLLEGLRPRHAAGLEPPLQGVGGEGLRGPAQREPQVEGAALVRPALVVVRRAVVGGDGHEVRRPLDRRLPLREPDVRAADHAHLAVRPGPRGRPLHRVVAVRRLLAHGVELALRAVAPAGVLVERGVAPRGEVAPRARIAVAAGVGRPPVVGGPLQDHGERAVTRRQVHLGREPDAVPHRRPLDGAAHAVRIAVLPLTRCRGRGRPASATIRTATTARTTRAAMHCFHIFASQEAGDEVQQHCTGDASTLPLPRSPVANAVAKRAGCLPGSRGGPGRRRSPPSEIRPASVAATVPR